MCASTLLDLCSHHSLLCWVELWHVRTAFPVTDLARILLRLRLFVWRACACADEAERSPICELLQIIVCVVWGRPASHKIVYMCSLLGGEEGWEDQREKEGKKSRESRSLTQIKWDYDVAPETHVGQDFSHGSAWRAALPPSLCIYRLSAFPGEIWWFAVMTEFMGRSWSTVNLQMIPAEYREGRQHLITLKLWGKSEVHTFSWLCREIDAWTGSGGHPRTVTVIFYSSL